MGRRKSGNIHGVLLLDKPDGMTSNHVLQQVRRHLGAGKAGHTGALDPLATGVLPLCFGEATKFSRYGLNADKVYQVRAALGEARDTADAEGTLVARRPVPELDPDMLQALFQSEFHGDIVQTPPKYSALKHEGKPLYQLAREGKPIPDKSRTITLHDTRLDALGPDWLDVTVSCSKGTYVRSLVEDIALRLGTLGHVSRLRRIRLGAFDIDVCRTLEETLRLSPLDAAATLLPPDAFLSHLPIRDLSDSELEFVRHGRAFTAGTVDAVGPVRLYAGERFCGLGEITDSGDVKCLRLVKSDLLE